MTEENQKDQLVEQIPSWAKKLMAQNETNQEELARLKAENEMLKDIAGKSKVEDWKERQKDKTIKTVHFKRIDGEIIIGWGPLDDSQFNPNAKSAYDENLFSVLQTLSGKEMRVNYSKFTTCKDLVRAIVKQKDKDQTTVEFEDGKLVTVKNQFLNA